MREVTPAERRALESYGRNGTVKQTAHELGKSPHTIERQLESARQRLNVTTTIEAYRIVRDIGK